MSKDDDIDAARGFMARWSRRKRAPDEVPDPEEVAEAEAATRAEAEAKAEAEAADTRTDDEILQDLGLRDPDTLGAGDDFKPFMSPNVPERFRVRALRKLWTSNPVLANLDGLNDYDGDYTGKVPGGLVQIGNIKTAYKVGRGLLKAIDAIVDEGPEAKTAMANPAGDTTEAGDTKAPPPETAEATAPDPAADDPDTPQAEVAENAAVHRAPSPEPEPSPRPGRRMAFNPVARPASEG